MKRRFFRFMLDVSEQDDVLDFYMSELKEGGVETALTAFRMETIHARAVADVMAAAMTVSQESGIERVVEVITYPEDEHTAEFTLLFSNDQLAWAFVMTLVYRVMEPDAYPEYKGYQKNMMVEQEPVAETYPVDGVNVLVHNGIPWYMN